VLRQVAEGVLIRESEFCQSNAVVVQGRATRLALSLARPQITPGPEVAAGQPSSEIARQ
jgi:hypothetical protein